MEAMAVTGLHGITSKERVSCSERICQLSEPLGDTRALFRGLLNLGYVHAHRFEAERAVEVGRRCLRLAEHSLGQEMLPPAYALLTTAYYRAGNLPEAVKAGTAAMKGFASPNQRIASGLVLLNLWALAPSALSLIEHALGRPDQALKLAHDALRRARQLKHPLSLAAVMNLVGVLHFQRGEPEATREFVEAEIELAEKHGFAQFELLGRALREWAIIEAVQSGKAVTELETDTASLPTFFNISKSILLARVYMRVNQFEKALAMINEELERNDQSGTLQEAAELRRLKGEAILRSGSSAIGEAESTFRKAIEIARGQSAKLWELRATVSLARLLTKQGRRNEARTMLAKIYNWFTEGFDTRDLQEAKQLLNELTQES
jgi:tetratricopeptide (TPR) repeat protein